MSSSRSRIDRRINGVDFVRSSLRTARRSSYPSRYGITRSLTIRSGRTSTAAVAARSPSSAMTTSYPRSSRRDTTNRQVTGSSSATRILLATPTSASDREAQPRAVAEGREPGTGRGRRVPPRGPDVEPDPPRKGTGEQPVGVEQGLPRRLHSVEGVGLRAGLDRRLVGPLRPADRPVRPEASQHGDEPRGIEVAVVEVLGVVEGPDGGTDHQRVPVPPPGVPGADVRAEALVPVAQIPPAGVDLDLHVLPRGAVRSERDRRDVDLVVEDLRGVEERVAPDRGPPVP